MSIDDRLRAHGAQWGAAAQASGRVEAHATGSTSADPGSQFTIPRPGRRHRPTRHPRPALKVSIAMLIVIVAVVVGAVVTWTRDGGTPQTVFGLPAAPARTDALRPTAVPPRAPNQGTSPVPFLTTRPPGHLLSMPWELVGLRDNARTLVVHYVGGDGVHPVGTYAIAFRVLDTPTRVELIAVSRNGNPGSEAQAASLQTGYGTITLPEAITGRVLLHAPANSNWSASLLR